MSNEIFAIYEVSVPIGSGRFLSDINKYIDYLTQVGMAKTVYERENCFATCVNTLVNTLNFTQSHAITSTNFQ
jgi:hypothetical protein